MNTEGNQLFFNDEKQEKLLKTLSKQGLINLVKSHRNKVQSLTDQLKQRDETIKKLKEALKEILPIAENYALTVDNPKWMEIFEHNKLALDKARKLIED